MMHTVGSAHRPVWAIRFFGYEFAITKVIADFQTVDELIKGMQKELAKQTIKVGRAIVPHPLPPTERSK